MSAADENTLDASGQSLTGLPAVIATLAAERPVFHSEADFQHSLAWHLKLADPAARIRLETRPVRGMRLDILVESRGRRTALELKYLVKRFHGDVGGEVFDLPDQSAHGISRYDVVKDIVRTESFVANGVADEGRTIVLTNDRRTGGRGATRTRSTHSSGSTKTGFWQARFGGAIEPARVRRGLGKRS